MRGFLRSNLRFILVGMLAGASLRVLAQQHQTPVYTTPPPPQQPPPQYLSMPSPYTKDVEAMLYMTTMSARSERQLQLHNIERQKQMMTDMERLATLVASLREQMSNPAAPDTADVGQRAAEIEKMAHKVGQGMKK